VRNRPEPLKRHLKLHHSGFVVAEISSAMPGFLRSLGAEWDGQVFEDPLQQVRVAFLATAASQALIELVEPGPTNAGLLRFLSEKGGGLHHLCFEVDDLESEIEGMRSHGSMIVKRPKPAVAFEGRRIAWILTPEKLLVELLEARVPNGRGSA